MALHLHHPEPPPSVARPLTDAQVKSLARQGGWFEHAFLAGYRAGESLLAGQTPTDRFDEGFAAALRLASRWCAAQASALRKLANKGRNRADPGAAKAFVEAANVIAKMMPDDAP